MRIFAAFLLCVAAPATAAFAEECNTSEKTPFAEECSKHETQQGLDQCYREAWGHSEQALGETYNTVVNRLQERPDAVLALELEKESLEGPSRRGMFVLSVGKRRRQHVSYDSRRM